MKLDKREDVLFTREQKDWYNLYLKWVPMFCKHKFVRFVNGSIQWLGSPDYEILGYDDFIAVELKTLKELDDLDSDQMILKEINISGVLLPVKENREMIDENQKLYRDPYVLFKRKHWEGLYIRWIPELSSFRYVRYVNDFYEIEGKPSKGMENCSDFITIDPNTIERKCSKCAQLEKERKNQKDQIGELDLYISPKQNLKNTNFIYSLYSSSWN
jgi:hypothetical protein